MGYAAGVAAGAALQWWQPRGLRYSCGSQWGCTAVMAAEGAALQAAVQLARRARQSMGLRGRCSGQWGCAAAVAADGLRGSSGATLQPWQSRGLRCSCDTREAAPKGRQQMGCAADVVAAGGCAGTGAAKEVAPRMWQPGGCTAERGSRGGCAAGVATEGAAPRGCQ